MMNDLETRADEADLTELVLGVAEGRVSKSEVAVFSICCGPYGTRISAV